MIDHLTYPGVTMPNDPEDHPWQRPESRERSERREDRYDDPPDRGGYRERPHYEEPHRGGLILALGLMGLLVCGICGIFAWMMGKADLQKMDARQMDPEGRGLTQAGKIMGLVSMILMIISLVVFVVMFVLFAVIGAGAAANAPAQPAKNPFVQPAQPVGAQQKW